ncbi:MAG: Obg family GTPase CgtA, partial [Clostridiales bacterium]|nr:Obg family GTPase CgtA [Clostridiales bacterium]
DIADGSERVYTFDEGKKYEIIINEDGNFEVTGKWINKIFNSTNFGDTESTNFFQRTLENEGVFEELKKMGVKEGDTVKVCDLEFDYYD